MMHGERLDTLSINQLMTVFRLCDPDRTGKIKINYLEEISKDYVGDQLQEIKVILNRLDARGKGSLTFNEFLIGIKQLRRCRQRRSSIKESMMSPTIEPKTGVNTTSTTLENGTVEPTFVLNSPPDSPRTADTNGKSQCSSLSDGENYEWNGVVINGGDIDADSGLAAERNGGDLISSRSPTSGGGGGGGGGINRHTWLRTSLRRSSPNHQDNLPNRRWGSFRHNGKRQLGSNALASQLYRSSSFNSSGRSSSTCDTADDMYSDASLEEDVHDLHHKFQVLQQQVGVLQDSAHQNDERYTRAKSDNAALQARVIMLEEQLRDTEMRNDERLQDEQRRSKELLSRLEREKQLQLENANIRLQAAESEAANLKDEVNRQRMKIEKLENERRDMSEKIQDLTNEVFNAKEEVNSIKEQERRLNQECETQVQLIHELSKEVERLRLESRTPALPTTSPETIRLEELHEEMSALRLKNKQLQEANDELQANLLHAGLEQGRMLTAGENSLAAELEAMTHDETHSLPDSDSLIKMQQALKEQQEVNLQLRSYIDGILLNIVENYPQLLEVKQRSV